MIRSNFEMPRVSDDWLNPVPTDDTSKDNSPSDSAAQKDNLALDGNGDVMTESITVTPNSNVRRLAQIIGAGEGNYESYNTGTRGVPGGRVGHSYVDTAPGTVTGKTINQVLDSESLPGTDPNRCSPWGHIKSLFLR